MTNTTIEYPFWANVNYLLKNIGSNQEKLSIAIDLSLNTIRNASSRNILPRVDVALRIAKYLNTSVENLLQTHHVQSDIFSKISDEDKEEKKAKIIEMIKEL